MMLSNEGLKTSRSTPTILLSSSKMSAGAVAFCALATVSSQHWRSVFISWLSSATLFPSADVRMITLKFFGLMLSINWRSLSFSSVVLIFCEIEILSPNGISTRYLPVRVISVVSLGPLEDMGSLTICTISSCPGLSKFVMVPCLSMSGSSFILDTEGTCFLSASAVSRKDEYEENREPRSR